MKTKFTTIAAFFFLSLSTAIAQDVTSTTAKEIIPVVKFRDNISVKFGGFVRAEYYVDSREFVGAVDDLFGFFPENKNLDADGKDLNDVVRQNLSIQSTRFNALFSAPDILGAKSSAFFEFDFSGGAAAAGSQGATSGIGVRLRHAWAKLAWTKHELLIGKTWNPLGETIFPDVVGLHTGIPFRPFSRAEQLRWTYKPTTTLSILAAAVYQSEHKTSVYDGNGGAESDIRSNPVPEFHLQLRYKSGGLDAGIVSEFKVIRPATQTTPNGGTTYYKTDKTVSSYALGAYGGYKENLFAAKGGVTYGQNLAEYFQQGGYATKSVDPATGAREYTVSNEISAWANLTYGKTWVAGLFGGYSKNLGFDDNILGGFKGRWANVDHIYRISPSISYNVSNWKFQAEVDYDVAAYGTIDVTDKGKVKDAKEISGVRGIFATTFFF